MCLAYWVRRREWLSVISALTSYLGRRENTVLRGELFEQTDQNPSALYVCPNVYVIPNALVPDQFKPSPCPSPSDTSMFFSPLLLRCFHSWVFQVTIVVLSRLAYRKGIDLLVAAAPRICSAFPEIKFLIGNKLFFPHLSSRWLTNDSFLWETRGNRS